MPLPPEELVRLADLNLVESIREKARWTPTGEVVEAGNLVRVLSPTRFAAGQFNCAVLTHKHEGSAGELFAELERFFSARDRGFTLQVCGERDIELEREAERLKVFRSAENPGMVLDAPLAEPALPPGVEVLVVQDAVHMAMLTEVEGRGWATAGMDRRLLDKVFAAPERMIQPHWHHVVVRLHGAPVAAAMALLSHGIAGLYWVATVPEMRGRGFAEIATRRAGNWAFAQGARVVVLQASAQGEPVYRRMGYRTFSRYPWFMFAKK